MKPFYGLKKCYFALVMGMLIFSLCGCAVSSDNQSQGQGTSADSSYVTTAVQTIAFPAITGLSAIQLSQISQYQQYGYGNWTFGPGLPYDPRTDIMPAGYNPAFVTKKNKLLNFFAMTDIHITDEESPSQLIYVQQLNAANAKATSIYSPVMMYTTQVLDAAIQTVNGLHRQNPFDFGISLGDVCNSTLYNELRWYIDILDGKLINPSSGAHVGAGTIDYQKPFQAAGLDKSIPWYQTLGNHDHFWLGSFPVGPVLQQSLISDTMFAAGDVLADPRNIYNPIYYMGAIDGSTPTGTIFGAGPVGSFSSAPRVVADPDRRSLTVEEWRAEFFNTTSSPVGHGFNLVDPSQGNGFTCYSFVPKSAIPLKVIVLDDTQRNDDGSQDIHGHGFLDQARWEWLKKQLADGDAAGQLMIIAAHIPIGVQPNGTELEWWTNPLNAVTLAGLLAELQRHPNFIMWIAGHRHLNTVKAFISTDPSRPENGFWQVETSSLHDYPQQFRAFEIYLNSDYTISIETTNVDPVVKAGTPAAQSRYYAVAAEQIVGTNLSPNFPNSDPNLPPNTLDPTIKSMLPSGSYNATLFKKLSSSMEAKLRSLF